HIASILSAGQSTCLAVLLGKPRIQPLYAPILLELSQRAGAELRQRTVIQLQQLFPQLRVMLSQLPQLVDTLERTAPAGRTVVNLIQPAEVKATVVTGLERLRLRDAPFHEGIPLV
ncbi:50S ribosomal protein L17, partial [Dysosmobacter welbionis]